MAHATAAHARPRLHLPRTVAAPDDPDGTRAALADLIAQRDALVRQADADARERSRLVARVEHLTGLLNREAEARGHAESASAQADVQIDYWRGEAERWEKFAKQYEETIPQYAEALAAKDTEIRELQAARERAEQDATDFRAVAEAAVRGEVKAERQLAAARTATAQLTHDLVVAGKLPLLVNMGPN